MTHATSIRAVLIGCCFVACGADDSLDSRGSALGSTSMVISQVYGGGGNVNSVYRNDFIEIFNTTGNMVSLAGWSIQYAGPATSSWQVTNLSGTVYPYTYYLIQEAQGLGGTTNLPPPQAQGNINMGSTSGKVALLQNQVALNCNGTSCLPNPAIVDFVGYGSLATSFEGSGPAPTLDNTTSDSRAHVGFVDTDDNAADFTAGAVRPRNVSICGWSATGGTGSTYYCGGSGGHPG